jgi:two-component system response regulator RpaA
MAKILVVDDKRESREPIARLLETAGYVVLRAADAHEAYGASQQHSPDLIILDVMIPPMDGLTLLWRLRESPHWRDKPVIVLTGLSDPHTKERAQELGVKDYLVKGTLAPEQILERIRQHIVVAAPASESAQSASGLS